MYKNRKIILFAFASKDLSNSASRLKKQAEVTNYYDEIKILSLMILIKKCRRNLKKLLTHEKTEVMDIGLETLFKIYYE